MPRSLGKKILPAILLASLAAVILIGCGNEYKIDSPAKSGMIGDDASDDTTGDDTQSDDDTVPSDTFEIVFIDVGLGDSTLITIPDLPSAHHVLIDGGKVGDGQYTVCPLLASKGISSLDVMVVTHPDYDHCGGLSEVFSCVTVAEVWENGDTEPTDDGWLAYVAARNAWGGPVSTPALNSTNQVGDAVFTVVNTLGDFTEPNDNSMVLKMDLGGHGYLFCADAQQPSQDWMASNQADKLPSDAIKVPDHGSYPFSQDFINAVSPHIAACSVGPNDLGLPDQRTLDAYSAVTSGHLYDTQNNGDITVTLDPQDNLVVTTAH